jgi:hypothetical protein
MSENVKQEQFKSFLTNSFSLFWFFVLVINYKSEQNSLCGMRGSKND